MLRINETNANFSSNDVFVYANEIRTDEDIHIENSYAFIKAIETTSNIKAQYELIILGDIKAKKIIVNNSLICFGNIDADELIVNGETYVSGNISAINIQFGGNATFGEMYTKRLVSNANVFSYGNLDIDEKIKVLNAIIGLEGISSAGTVESRLLIAKEYLDCDNKLIDRLVIVDEAIDKSAETPNNESEARIPEEQELLFKDFSSLSNYDSQEYKNLDKFRKMFDKKIEYLSETESTDLNELISVAANLGEHIEEYEKYYRTLVTLKKSEKELKDKKYFFSISKLSNLLDIPNALPEWMSKANCMRTTIQNIATQYSDNYNEIDFNITDMVEWARNLKIITANKDLFNELIFSFIIDKIFNNIGYKKKAVDKFFTL